MANITGTNFDDALNGTVGDDTLSGLDGNDILNGLEGSDTLLGGRGNDVLDGGADNDTLDGGEDDDRLIGGTGVDMLIGGLGSDRLEDNDGANNTLLGGDGNDTLLGTGTLDGGAGNDSIVLYGSSKVTGVADGGDGNDNLSYAGGGTNDILRGGAGNDTLYAGTSSTATLDGGDGDDTLSVSSNWRSNDTMIGGAGNDTIRSYHGNDVLQGDAGNDHLDGGADNDTLNGGDGDDTLIGGSGNDIIDGGADNSASGTKGDIAVFSGNRNTYAITRDASDPSALRVVSTIGGEEDLVRNVETLRFSDADYTVATLDIGQYQIGTDNDESLTGTAFDDVISGGLGNDTIDGGDGRNRLLGGEGDDSLTSGANDDYLSGGTGVDTLSGGAGSDYLDDNDGANNTLLGGDGNDTLLGTGTLDGGAGNDSIVLYGSSKVTGVADGGDGNDNLSYAGGGTNDILRGGAGNDTLYAGTSSTATLDGGDGDDTLSVSSNWSSNDTMIGGAGNDTIRSYYGNDVLQGDAGNDYLDGGFDNDTLSGGDGDDTLIGGSGNDTLDGGADNSASGTLGDIAVFSGTRANYSVVGDAVGLTIYDNRLNAPDGIDRVTNVETIRFSDGDADVATAFVGLVITGTSGDDNGELGNPDALIGSILNDQIFGLAGNDLLIGLQGLDLLVGGDGNDTLKGDEGADTLLGGTGDDFLYGGDQDDDLSGDEGNDSLFGQLGDDVLSGGDGDDILSGSSGNDTLDGGNDLLGAGGIGDIAVFDGARADYAVTADAVDPSLLRVTALDGSEEDGVRNVEVFRFSDGDYSVSLLGVGLYIVGSDVDDVIVGTENGDVIKARFGNDAIDAGNGNNRVEAGDGNDTVTSGTGDDVIFGGNGNDVISSGAGADTIIDTDGANMIDAGEGNDTVDASGSTSGGGGNDAITYRWVTGATDDLVSGGDGDDTITVASSSGPLANLTFEGNAGNDLIRVANTNSGSERMFGGTGDDTLLSGGGDDFLSGDEGADYLDGGHGNDTLLGGEGDDEFIGGGGNDRIDGGSDGNASGSAGDIARFSGQRSQYSVVLGSEGVDVYDNRLTAPDGVDRLTGIENIVFSDLTMTFDSSISGLVVTGTPGDDNGLSGNPSKLIGTQLDDRILGLDGNDVLIGDAGADILVGGFGADSFEASLSDLDGDLIEDFSAPDTLWVTDALFSVANLQITPSAGNTIIGIDADLNGAAESTFTLQGSFAAGDFIFAPASAGGTLISLVNTGAPTASARSIPPVSPGTSIPLSSLFSWSDPDGEADILEFSVVDQSVGGGYLTLDGSPVTQDEGITITNIPLSQIDRWAFVSGADGEFDNIGFAVTDSSGNTSDATVAYVESDEASVVLKSASTAELEYFARQSAYGYGPLGTIGATAATDDLSVFLDGWEIEYVFGTSGDTFRAVALHKEGYAPVLAFRGTVPTDAFDWSQNFIAAKEGVGAKEFNDALSFTGMIEPAAQFGSAPTLAQYLASKNGLTLTGHSQGGAQAQIAAINAGNAGADIGQVVTFNSAGITFPKDEDIVPSADRVTHFVNASDIVSVVGETFLEGDILYYDHTDSKKLDLSVLLTAHSAQWMQHELRAFFPGESFPDSKLISPGPGSAFTAFDYSPISFVYGQDREYLEMMIDIISIGYVLDDLEDLNNVLNVPQTVINLIRDDTDIRTFIDDVLTPALSTRGKLEAARQDHGPFIAKLLNAVGTVGQFIQDGVSFVVDGVFDVVALAQKLTAEIGAIVSKAVFTTVDQTVNGLKMIAGGIHGIGEAILDGIAAGSGAVKDWFIDRLDGPAPVVVQDGAHAGSTPAIIINTADGAGAPLSSTASGSLFLLTAPNSSVLQEKGENVTWGLPENINGLRFVAPLSEFESEALLRTTLSSEPSDQTPLAFTTTDALFVHGVSFGDENIEREVGSAILRIDFDGDGLSDATVTMEGKYRLASFVTEATEDGTYIRYLGNAVPVAENDDRNVLPEGFVTDEDSAFTTANVLVNDSDEDGDVLHISGIDTTSTLGQVLDNGDGTFNYNPNGAFDYLNAGESATDSFVYTVSDGNGGNDTAMVTLTINGVNHTFIANDDNGTVNEDSSVMFSFAQLFANDINVDGVNQTITAIDATGTAGSVVLDTVNRTITYSADADAFDLLATGDTAKDSFKYTLQGSSGEIGTATVAISVVGVDDGVELFGTVRRDTLNGTSGEDLIKGDNGNDIINGGEGADHLFGGNGNDRLYGGNSIDTLMGGNGNDRLEGGDGNDWLSGEKGNDILTGGSGSDVFAFAKAEGRDIITDFTKGTDKIQIATNTGITNFSQLEITGKTDSGSSIYTTIDLGHGDKIFLTGVSPSQLDATDFIFPV